MGCDNQESWQGLKPASVAQMHMAVEINAPRERVWKAMTGDIGRWWLPDFHMAHPQSTMHWELEPGGRMYEKGPDGSCLQWFHVAAVKAGESVHVSGYLMPPWGGPATIMSWISLEESEPGKTTLRFTECVVGIVDESAMQSMHEGWTMLWGSLKKFAEADR